MLLKEKKKEIKQKKVDEEAVGKINKSRDELDFKFQIE